MVDPDRPRWGRAFAAVLLGIAVFLGTSVAVEFAGERLGFSVRPLVVVAALLVAIAVAVWRRR